MTTLTLVPTVAHTEPEQLRVLPPVWIDGGLIPTDELDREARLALYTADLLRHAGSLTNRASPTTLAELRRCGHEHADLAVRKGIARQQQRRQEYFTLQWAETLTDPPAIEPQWSTRRLLAYTVASVAAVLIAGLGWLASPGNPAIAFWTR